MNKELQRAQDMITAMQAQRDNALNTVVMMQADLADARRTIDEMNKELTEARAQLAAAQDPEPTGEDGL
jgi:predicted  nucleic acid-binding Zn-ribbon protein